MGKDASNCKINNESKKVALSSAESCSIFNGDHLAKILHEQVRLATSRRRQQVSIKKNNQVKAIRYPVVEFFFNKKTCFIFDLFFTSLFARIAQQAFPAL